MSGNKQKDKKGKELLYRASLGKEFQENIKKLRKKFSIPLNGYKSKEQVKKWHKENNFDAMLDLWIAQEKIAKKYNLPISSAFLFLLMDYTLSNNKVSFHSYSDIYVCELDNPAEKTTSQTELVWKESEQPFIKILVSDIASIEDVQIFIKDKWKDIQQELGKKRLKPKKRIRESKNKKRDELIFELSKKTREELGLKKKDFKDMKISSIMKEKYKIDVSPDNIRKIIQKQRELRGL